ncbi:long-chain-fatty-acid--CoA ligase [Roseiarcus sp.]|uniref:long-chain-fatty-acid--CoA ligase n=1 Tax=Roseiarcus sp. TaxID=1969460 RepID=UPI003F980EB1
MSTTFGLHRAVLFNGNGVATQFENRSLTWIETADRVARLAGALREFGVGRGDRVAILMLNQDRYLELYLATAWAGAVVAPLNIRWSAGENQACLTDCRPKILVVDAAFAKMGEAMADQLSTFALLYADDAPDARPKDAHDYEEVLAAAAPIPDVEASEADLAGIFYTGGTTGRSKGVMLSHRNLLASARNALSFSTEEVFRCYLHVAPMFHLANASGMYLALLLCGSNAIIRAFSPDGVARAIERFRVSNIVLVPTMIQMFVDQPGLDQFDLSSLKRVTYGASPISEAVLDRAIKALPHVEFFQAYGMTELSPVATVLPWKDHIGEGRAKGRHRSGGRPAAMVEVRIVDPYGAPLPPREVGEIVARGDIVMMGYWERPEETKRAIVDGWMHTGDAGYMDEDAYVYIVDRIKDMIVTGGENVYSAEVENCVAQHPAVAQCAVIGIPDERWGEAVHAVVMRKPGVIVSEADIIDFCRARIAHYKCPRSVKIQDDPLPLSGAGKILKRELRKPFWEGTARQVN